MYRGICPLSLQILNETDGYLDQLTEESVYGYNLSSAGTALDTVATNLPSQSLSGDVSSELLLLKNDPANWVCLVEGVRSPV